jgi:hypothetical protein
MFICVFECFFVFVFVANGQNLCLFDSLKKIVSFSLFENLSLFEVL